MISFAMYLQYIFNFVIIINVIDLSTNDIMSSAKIELSTHASTQISSISYSNKPTQSDLTSSWGKDITPGKFAFLKENLKILFFSRSFFVEYALLSS